MGSQRLRPLPWGMTAKAWWVLPQGTLTDGWEAAAVAPWRPALDIYWRPGPTLTLVLMNPSAATAEQLDATVRNALYFALRLDISGEPVGRLIVVNAFDIRATDLDVAAGTAEVQLEQDGERVSLGKGLPLISAHCDELMAAAVREADLVICGWGAKVGPERTRELLRGPLAYQRLHAWRMGGDGFPRHPRGQKKDAMPRVWAGGRLGEVPSDLHLRVEARRPRHLRKRLDQTRLYGFEAVNGSLLPWERAQLWRWG